MYLICILADAPLRTSACVASRVAQRSSACQVHGAVLADTGRIDESSSFGAASFSGEKDLILSSSLVALLDVHTREAARRCGSK